MTEAAVMAEAVLGFQVQQENERLRSELSQLNETAQVIPPLPSLFTLLRPYLAHFFPENSRFLRVFTVSPRRFQRAASRNPGPRNSRQGGPNTVSTPNAIAGFLFEQVQGYGGIHILPKEYVQRMAALVKSYDGTEILTEIPGNLASILGRFC